MKKVWGSVAMLTATLLWGVAFSAQSRGMDFVEPMLFTSLRSAIGVIALVVVIMIFDLFREKTVDLVGQCRYSGSQKRVAGWRFVVRGGHHLCQYCPAVGVEVHHRREDRIPDGFVYRYRAGAGDFSQTQADMADVDIGGHGFEWSIFALRRYRFDKPGGMVRHCLCIHLFVAYTGDRPLCREVRLCAFELHPICRGICAGGVVVIDLRGTVGR